MACRPFARPGRQQPRQPDPLQHLGRVVEDLLRRAPVVEAQQQRNQALDQHRIAVGAQVQRAGCRRLGHQPHLALAAAHLVALGLQHLRQRRQVPAELDHVLDLVAPVLEERELLLEAAGGVGDGGVVRHGRDMRRAVAAINLRVTQRRQRRRAIRSVRSRRGGGARCRRARPTPALPWRLRFQLNSLEYWSGQRRGGEYRPETVDAPGDQLLDERSRSTSPLTLDVGFGLRTIAPG